MKLKSLSASAALTFEGCAARFKTEYVDKVPQPSNSAADLGTVCHATLEDYVQLGMWKLPRKTDDITRLYTTAYESLFTDRARFDEGLQMCLKWQARTDWTGRQVISTELKETFPIKTSQGELGVTYIWDRFDDLGDGEYEVVDYKTIFAPVKPGDMKDKIQVRIYALAAQIKYPKAKRIWVTLDLLRYEPVSVAFSRDENIETWRYLHRLAERAIASDGTEETLHGDCRYCVRKHVCETLQTHAAAGGALGITDPEEAAQRRYELAGAQKAIDVALEELDEVILGYCRQEELLEFDAGKVKVQITAKPYRTVDPASAARVLGPELAAEFPGGIKMAVVDKLLKEKPCRLTTSQESQLRGLIRKEFGEANVKVAPRDVVKVS